MKKVIDHILSVILVVISATIWLAAIYLMFKE